MKVWNRLLEKLDGIAREIADNHVGAYAAQSAYFFMLCLIPILLLMITMVQYTPVTKADVMTAAMQVFPSSVHTMITSIINQVYNRSRAIIPLTVLVALWSAGKGVMAMATGLNGVYRCRETRNYVVIRIRSTIYTIFFLLVIISLLVLGVFGNLLQMVVQEHVPVMERMATKWIQLREVITFPVLILFILMIYKFLPNKKHRIREQIVGAFAAATGWMAVSWVFSMYLDIFKGFSDMYGSLATIVLIMLWMYFCMYCVLLGGNLNRVLQERKGKEKDASAQGE
ncbi:YihY/virulence factor BrkB family protein [Suipraeoptans intestinalis]|uniref:YihY/virulence factor BrkB family protein n=1 Tax=Suipraeoptans intestinalis TaxID=2606628 RepID=A0A6N7UY65_9FIRM|nr:YihY/virulence factor BrkB family protein [Suipraeoptans intestinalis]MDD7770482.1 YihY/virulence factor BrkB family protein [Suipraeoptans intestinalis]MDY3122345.1 YihY/virulence factor BrkB family protein [Suipraeoptans intestinalis]MSR93189.1 YihY/virulence factor BrkB family protein [Suipraeoptans intestinalis]